MADTVLSIDELTVGYGNTSVVRNFNLSVSSGEFVSLLGPSGCGKTTILRTIAGFIPSSSGTITLQGQNVTKKPPEQRDVGIVFQNYALFPTMTIFENIAFGLRVLKLPSAEINKKVNDIAEVSGITEHLQKKPAALSGGQQQRAAIARVLVMKSSVLLFDEPLSNLDANIRVAMRREIKRLQSEFGFTAIFVTHDQEEALAMSDRIAVLNNGAVEQIGTGPELYRSPASPFMCEFIGSSNKLSSALAKRLLGKNISGDCYVRYEDLLLHAPRKAPKATAKQATKMVDGIVENIEFLGHYSRIDCSIGNERVSSISYDVVLSSVGKPVGISIRDGAGHVFGGNQS